ncbi:hypothetical protein F4824DRAFT_61738 [Ustulina deusta]|nr:hypothetical protein F4824DRAFT_61738 [Ustulina deusta]
MGNSLIDHINYNEKWIKISSAIQAQQMINVVKGIRSHLADHNTILASGSADADGFARPVYDFTRKKIGEAREGGHMFFLYHPDTNRTRRFTAWRGKSPSEQLCAKSDNLDTACQFMPSVRGSADPMRDDGQDVVFHLLTRHGAAFRPRSPLPFPTRFSPSTLQART